MVGHLVASVPKAFQTQHQPIMSNHNGMKLTLLIEMISLLSIYLPQYLLYAWFVCLTYKLNKISDLQLIIILYNWLKKSYWAFVVLHFLGEILFPSPHRDECPLSHEHSGVSRHGSPQDDKIDCSWIGWRRLFEFHGQWIRTSRVAGFS